MSLLLRVLVLPAALLVALPPAAQTVQLNAPFEGTTVAGNVRDFALHAAVGEVLFRVDARWPGALELYRVPLDGSRAPLPVVALAAGRSVWAYEFTPDGQWLLWRGEKERDDEVGLYHHRVGTPGSTRLSPREHGDVDSFALVGTRVLYVANSQPSPFQARQLYSVPVDGSAVPVRLSPESSATLGELAHAEGSARVAFTCRDQSDVVRLYSAPLDGSAPALELDVPSRAPFWWQQDLALTPDGSHAVYSAFVGAVHHVRSVRLDGSTPPVELAGGSVPVQESLLAPDGARLVFTADPAASGRPELHSVPIDGGTPLRINDALVGSQQLELATLHAERAYYLRTFGGTVPRLFSVPIAGGAPALQLATYGGTFGPIRFTADGTRAVFQTGSDGIVGFFPEELFSVPLDASSPPVLIDGSSFAFELSPDSTRVLFSRNHDDGGVLVARLDGSAPAVTIVPGGTSQGDIRLGFTPDSAGVVVVIDGSSESPAPRELYRASVTGAGLRKLSGALARGTAADVLGFHVPPSGERVLYQADALVDNRYELFTVGSDGSPAAQALSGTGQIGKTMITPDGARAVYGFDAGLWSAPCDASAAPLQLSPPIALGRTVTNFWLTADGVRAVYLVAGGALPWELWSVPVAGGGAQQIGSAPEADFLVLAGDAHALYRAWDPALTTYRLRRTALDGSGELELAQASIRAMSASPDGAWVLYTALPHGLFVVPSDGSAPPAALEAALSVPEVTGRMTITPDSREAVYLARDPLLTQPVGLFAAPLDRSAPPRRLSQAFGTTQGVRSFVLAPGGTRVVYAATDLLAPEHELFSVPLDGSSGPVALDGTLGALATTSPPSYAPTPDGTRVVFVAQDLGEHHLYVAPLDGSAAPLRLSGSMVAGGDVAHEDQPFVLSPDSTRVVYCADQVLNGVFELWLVPLDGSAAPLRLNRPVVNPGVSTYAFAPDGRHLFYEAPERTSVNELFSVDLTRLPKGRALQRR